GHLLLAGRVGKRHRGRQGRRRAHRVPGGPVHHRPCPRPRHQPRSHPYRCRLPSTRARRRRGCPGPDEVALAPNLLITLDRLGKVADFRRTAELDDAEQTALDGGQAMRRGTGYTLRVDTLVADARR
ncbi:hypothetical protein ACFU9Y_24695, partial [Streptomyces sp. NPDC057621]